MFVIVVIARSCCSRFSAAICCQFRVVMLDWAYHGTIKEFSVRMMGLRRPYTRNILCILMNYTPPLLPQVGINRRLHRHGP